VEFAASVGRICGPQASEPAGPEQHYRGERRPTSSFQGSKALAGAAIPAGAERANSTEMMNFMTVSPCVVNWTTCRPMRATTRRVFPLQVCRR
jgi:hypothetical protein